MWHWLAFTVIRAGEGGLPPQPLPHLLELKPVSTLGGGQGTCRNWWCQPRVPCCAFKAQSALLLLESPL